MPNWDMPLAVTAKILPARLPYNRCPSDGFDTGNPAYSSYIGSQGPQCNDGACSPRADPFNVNCNGQPPVLGDNTMTPISPPTHPGYAPSVIHGGTDNASLCRGMMCRGTSVTAPLIRIASVTDGLSNTIMLGEGLVEQMEFQRYGDSFGWAGYNSVSQGQTIQPINWFIDGKRAQAASVGWTDCATNCTAVGVKPENCIWNWHVTWGFKSNHTGGVNFCFGDGSVRFIQQNIDMRTYQYLGCRDDGQVVTIP